MLDIGLLSLITIILTLLILIYVTKEKTCLVKAFLLSCIVLLLMPEKNLRIFLRHITPRSYFKRCLLKRRIIQIYLLYSVSWSANFCIKHNALSTPVYFRTCLLNMCTVWFKFEILILQDITRTTKLRLN